MMQREFQLLISNRRFEDRARRGSGPLYLPFGRTNVICRHSAFTFIEVLFATILLGIGFIMIAAVFPVAIQQTSAVSDETQANAVEQDAIKKLQALGDAAITPNTTYGWTNSLFQPTLRQIAPNQNVPVICALSYATMQALGSDVFFSADHRYGWVGFYRRDSFNSPFATVYIIALQNPNFPNYTTTFPPGGTTAFNPMPPNLPTVAPPIPPLLYNYSGSSMPTNNTYGGTSSIYTPFYSPTASAKAMPSPATLVAGYAVQLAIDSNGNATIQFPAGTQNLAVGAFALIADDGTTAIAANTPAPPMLTGRFLRLGSVDSADVTGMTYFLQPGYDFTKAELTQLSSANGSAGGVDVFLIGAAPTADSTGGFTGPFTGPNQDIGVATAIIRVNTANN
jgi:type II secretory pathway pseudopilin PulG